MHCLVYSSDPSPLEALGPFLGESGFARIRNVGNERHLREILNASGDTFDLILLDLDGYRAENPCDRSLPRADSTVLRAAVLAFGSQPRSQASKSTPLAFDYFLRKPFGREALLKAMSLALSMRKQRQRTLLLISSTPQTEAALSRALAQFPRGPFRAVTRIASPASLKFTLTSFSNEIGAILWEPSEIGPEMNEILRRHPLRQGHHAVPIFGVGKPTGCASYYRTHCGLYLETPSSPKDATAALSAMTTYLDSLFLCRFLLRKARRLQQQGSFRLAELVLREILFHNPFHAETTSLLGDIARQRNRPNDANGFYRRALELNPYLVHPYIGLSAVLAQSARQDERRTLLERAIRFCPGHPRIRTLSDPPPRPAFSEETTSIGRAVG